MAFFFDLTSPETYLAAERVDRLYTDVRWTAVIGGALHPSTAPASSRERTAARVAMQRRADALGLPLIWPDRVPASACAAMRVATYAAGRGRAAAFALAAGRLMFCGGFDLDDPDILAEASAAAGLPLSGCLGAAGDRRLDGAMRAAGRRLAAEGADELPVLRIGRSLFAGERRFAEAASAWSGGRAVAGIARTAW